jgi:selenocysteine-specific elongation factor
MTWAIPRLQQVDAMRLIGTAGHIDHGKSTLVQALTGIHPSHLPEEHAREMTIDLGYAYLQHPDGHKLGVVDVPGHEKLVRNMVAGATGFELALWVVDARESVMPQSLEHLQILDLLGVRCLLPVLTKADLASEEQIAGARVDMEALLRRGWGHVEPLHVVDSVSGRGIAELKQAIFALCRDRERVGDDALPYLPIDRVFTLKGIGTVVTGTLMRGRLAEGDTVALSSAPGTWRVRSLDNHHARVREIGAGHRVGINLAALDANAVRRGDTLVAPEYPYTARFVNARLQLTGDEAFEWKHGLRMLFYVGAVEMQCRLWGLEREGEAVWVQLELPRETHFFRGQRFILRSTNPLVTVGGGEVLDLAPDRPRRITPAERSAYTLRGREEPWLAAYLAGARTPVLSIATLARRWMVPEADLYHQAEASPEVRVGSAPAKGTTPVLVWPTEWEADLLSRFRAFVESQPRAEQSIPYAKLGRKLSVNPIHLPSLLACLVDLDDPAVAFLRDHIRLEKAGLVLYPGLVSWTDQERALADRILARLNADGLRPSRVQEYREDVADQRGLLDIVLAKLHDDGRVVRINEEFVLHSDAAAELRRVITHGTIDGARAGEWGRALGLSRKYSIPYFDYLNREGILRRVDDVHFRIGRAAG